MIRALLAATPSPSPSPEGGGAITLTWDATDIALLIAVIHAIIVFVAAVRISATRPPSSAIAWVLAIAFMPLIGITWFLLIGAGRLPEHRRLKQQEVNRLALERTENLGEVGHSAAWPPYLATGVELTRRLGALPMVGGNRWRLHPDYDSNFTAMADDIDLATEMVNVEFYILVLDPVTQPVFDAMARAVQRGVRVRVMSDHVASLRNANHRGTLKALKAMGAEYEAMLPLRPFKGQWQRPDLRNHRKLITIDHRIGWMGSINLVQSSYGLKKNIKRGLHWHDLMVRLEGPVVRELDVIFAADWFSETNELIDLDTTPIVLPDDDDPDAPRDDMQVVPSGPSFENDINLKLFVYLINSAQRRLSITSPYFVPDEATMMAIVTAASRGVHVELFVSEIGDQFMVFHAQRSYYEELLKAGVTIWLYKAPTVLHAKHFTVDDDVAVIGSSNMDIRSFALDMESSLLVHGRSFVDALNAIDDDYRANSTQLLMSAWKARPGMAKIWDSLMRMTSSLQ